MSKRICPDCGRKLTMLDRFFCSGCGCKLPKALIVATISKEKSNG